VSIVALDHVPSPLGFSSRYLSQKFHVENNDAALALLERLGQNGGGMIVPTNDHYLILVSKNFDSLSRRFTLTTPPWEVLEPLMDLSRLYESARGIGIKTPDFFKPQDEREMRGFVGDLDFRGHHYLLRTRPEMGRADAATGRYTKVAGSDAPEMLENCREIYRRIGQFPLIVEVVPGEADRCLGVCMVVGRNHEALVSYCVRRLKLFTYSRGGRFVHPYELGANVFCESAHDDEAIEAAGKLVRRMKYFGPITLEFRRDSTDESLTLIKADPRPVRATALARALGMDVPLAVYREFTSQKPNVASSYPDGIAWIWVSEYLESLWQTRGNRAALKELLALVGRWRAIKAAANLDLRDPMPFLVELKRWSRRFASIRFNGLRKRLAGIRHGAIGEKRAGLSG
jgi:predicted ATP-grasp superfamily ATP-dependent carboligase